MRNVVAYEWVCEEVDENGDIQDCDYTDIFPGLPRDGVDVGLCRRTGNNDDGETGRTYAYIDKDTLNLPESFDDGTHVPMRFIEEVCSRTMSKDAAQRKRDERARMRAKGYTLRQVWVRPKDWVMVLRYITRVARRND